MAAEAAELAFVATMRDEATAAARAARRQLDSLGGDTKPIRTAVRADVDQALRGVADVEAAMGDLPATAKDEGEEAGQQLGKGMASGLKGAKGMIVGAVAALGVGAALTESLDTDAAVDRLSASLGATPGEAKRYGKIAGDLYAGAWGDSMADVTGAVEAVSSSISGLGKGRGLKDATAAALDYVRTFQVDVSRAAQVAGLAVKTGLADNARGAFDLLTAASQRVPKELREDVLDAVEEYGPFFKSIGYDGPAAFGILAAGAARGQYGIDKAGDALKEFTIRATDMSTTSTDAYKAIGLDAQSMSDAILAGGDRAKAATDKIIAGILGIENPTKRANTAIALFGTPLEDLGVRQIPGFLRSLSSASSSLGNVEGASRKAGDTLNDNAKTNLVSFGRQAKQQLVNIVGGQALPALTDLASYVSTNFGPAFDTAKAAVKDAVGWLKEHETTSKVLLGIIVGLTAVTAAHSAVLAVGAAGGMKAWLTSTRLISGATKVWAAVQWAMNAALAANPIVLVALALAALAVALVVAWKKSDQFRAIVLKAWEAIKGGVLSAVRAVTKWVGAAWEWIKGATAKTWAGIKAALAAAWAGIKAAFTVGLRLAVALVTGGFGKIKDLASSAMSWVRDKIAAGWTTIKQKFSEGVSSAVAKAKELGTKVKDAITGFVSDMGGIGEDLIRGLIGGIGRMAGAAVQKAKDVVGGAVSAAKNLLGISSPSKVFDYFGRMTIEGYLRGLSRGRKGVRRTLGRVFDVTRKYFAKRIENEKAAAKAARIAIRHYGEEVTAIRANARAWDRLNAVRKRAAGYVKSIRDEAVKLTTIDPVNDAPVTAGFLVQGFADRLKAIRKFGRDLKRARRAGVDRAYIEEIAAAGYEDGAEYARALASATPEQIKAINAARGDIAKASESVGEGVTLGVSRQLKRIEREGKRLARALLRGIRRELKIKSPSRETAGDGADTARGLAAGILAEARTVEDAARTVADRVSTAIVPTLPDLAGMAGAAGRMAPIMRTAETLIIRHEVVSPDGSVSRYSAEQIADLIARDPRSAAQIERALGRARRRVQSRTITSSR